METKGQRIQNKRADSGACRKSQIQKSLTDNLFEFTMTFLLEHPKDTHQFARKYFHRLESNKRTTIVREEVAISDLEEEYPRFRERRKPVYAAGLQDPEAIGADYVKPFYAKTNDELMKLRDVARNIFILHSLDEEQLEDVLNAMFRKYVSKDEVVITEGETGDYFYVIESGTYHVFQTGQEPKSQILIHTYENIGFFGELALLYNQPRAATVKAATEGVLWALDGGTFRHLVMDSAYTKRQRYEVLINTVPILKALKPYDKLRLADALESQRFVNGERIVEICEEVKGMYFIQAGAASIKKMRGGKETEVKRVEVGGYFGDRALLMNKRFPANVYAVGDTKIAFLDKIAFEHILGSVMDFLQQENDSVASSKDNSPGDRSQAKSITISKLSSI